MSTHSKMSAPDRSWALWALETAMSLFVARSFRDEAGARCLAAMLVPAAERAARAEGRYDGGAAPAGVAASHRVERVAGAPSLCPSWAVSARGGETDVEQTKSVTVFHVHGGAHILPASALHWTLAARLVDALSPRVGGATAVRCVLPLYPLALLRADSVGPREVLDALEAALRAACAPAAGAAAAAGPVVISGDSAGGGLALALAQRLAARPDDALARRVASIALFSPWVDMSLSLAEQMRPLEAECCMLRVEGLAACGRWQCGARCALRDPEASPLFGRLAGLAPVSLFVGDRELLRPEGHALRERLEAAGAGGERLRFVAGAMMPHVWPLLGVPESEAALNALLEGIVKDTRAALGEGSEGLRS